MINHLSASSYSTFKTCPRLYRYRYVDQVPLPEDCGRSVHLVFGSVFHETMEQYFLMRESGDAALSPAELFEGLWESALDNDQPVNWYHKTEHFYRQLGLSMFRYPVLLGLMDRLHPLILEDGPAVEKKIVYDIPHIPIPVVGYIDLITDDGVPCDFKTAGQAWSDSRADDADQPTFYIAGLREMDLDYSSEGLFRYYVITKRPLPSVQTISTKRTTADIEALYDSLLSMWTSVSMSAFPRNLDAWNCNARYCDYWSLCRGDGRRHLRA